MDVNWLVSHRSLCCLCVEHNETPKLVPNETRGCDEQNVPRTAGFPGRNLHCLAGVCRGTRCGCSLSTNTELLLGSDSAFLRE